MSKTAHGIFISVLVAIVFITFIALFYNGLSYYRLDLADRVYHPDHPLFKPSGTYGHGFGIVGSLLMIIGMGSYMARKRFRFLSRMGLLKHWLEFHIFLCTLGPMLVLFHTSYKFGGLVAVSFWSMVVVFLSGIIGRFIYIQIPRSIEGRELSLSEVREMRTDIAAIIRDAYNLDEGSHDVIAESVKKKVEIFHKNPIVRFYRNYRDDRKSYALLKRILVMNNLPRGDHKRILGLVKSEINLNRKIDRLDTMKNLFGYWHVAHLPFALVMLIIMLIHVGVALIFGYKWIF
jgi:hypothetical protein